nr:unnamed protein product [Callosobruchus analis]
MASSIVQYVIVRSDLLKELQWPVGALIAQACHAVTAAPIFSTRMNTHKRILKIWTICTKSSRRKKLDSIGQKLEENDVKHKLWIEQPENIPTCLVVKPYPKEEVQKYFKKFKLFKT